MKTKQFFKAVAVLAILLCHAIPQAQAGASAGTGLPVYADFIRSIRDGETDVVRGVYVPDVMAFPVVQQPANQPSMVTKNENEVTQFGSAARYKVIGLLAHNSLAGAYFYDLGIGQEIRIIYGDGRVQYFVVDHLYRFSVIHPNSRDMAYMDLRTKQIYPTQELFDWFYTGDFHVTFQTCIQKGDDPSWGRLFITAIPVPAYFFRELKAMNLSDLQMTTAVIHALGLMSENELIR